MSGMDPRIIVGAQRALHEEISRIEREKNRTVTPAARIILEALLLESLTTRESDWRTRANLTFEAAGSANAISDRIRQSFSEVLTQAWIDQSGEFITAKDVLSAIQKKWCNIFPIC